MRPAKSADFAGQASLGRDFDDGHRCGPRTLTARWTT